MADASTPTLSGTEREVNQLHDALSKPRRRRVLRVLERQRTLALAELAEIVARAEREDAAADEPSPDARTVRVELVHCDLPKLDEFGLVDYATDPGEVSISTQPPVDGWSAVLRECAAESA